MGIFEGVYFACDLDGTLIDHETNEVSEANALAIKRFMAEGGLFGLATGRISDEAAHYITHIGVNAPSVTGNGATIYDFTTGYRNDLAEIEEDILPFFGHIERDFPQIMIEIVSSDDIIYCCHPNIGLKLHSDITISTFKEVPSLEDIPKPWLKVALWSDAEGAKHLAKNADTSLLPDRYNFMHSFIYCCEISRKDADKGTGLLAVKSMLPAVRLTCAMGDNENDVKMLGNADISFVPSNAVESAKKAAEIILESDCSHSAVAEALARLEEMLMFEKG